MLNSLIRFSLAQRVLVLTVAFLTVGLAAKKFTELPVEVLPDLTKPTVTILTEAPGFAPEEVENRITIPLERTLMGVRGVTRLRTKNEVALSLVYIEFDWGTDIDQARNYVQNRLSGASEFLPDGITPYMTPASSLMGDIMLIGLRDPSGQNSTRDLREYSEWVIGRRIQSIPGIAEVLSMGGGIRQIQVQPDPERMLAQGVSYEEIKTAASKAIDNSTGGFLTEQAQEIMVRNLAMSTNVDEIASTVVAEKGGRAILLSDVAKVVWDLEPMRGDAGMGTKAGHEGPEPPTGSDGIILSVRKSPGFDTIDLTEKVEAAMEDLRKSLPEGAELLTIYRQQDYIDLSINNLKEALTDGTIMVIIILFLFLLNFRVTLITLTAIPLSLAITILVFDLFELSVNSMTLGGIAVAIGMVVDDAIVDVENVFRRLRENARENNPRPRLEVIAQASSEVRSSIFYATLLIILVFVPLLALSGVEGRLFTPIAIATIVSMAASFLVSLTVIPILSSLLLHPKPGKEHRENLFIRGLKEFFELTWLRLALYQPLVVIALVGFLLAFAIYTTTKMGGAFLPGFNEPTLLVATTAPPGSSLQTTGQISRAAQNRLLEIEGVETVGYRIGRAERGDHVVPVSTVEFEIEFNEHGTTHRKETKTQIMDTMKLFPGTFSTPSSPLADRLSHMLTGVAAKVAIKIYGPDLETLDQLGQEVIAIAKTIPGLEEATMEQQAPVPQLRIEPDRKRAAAYLIAPGDITSTMASLMGGEIVAEAFKGERSYDLVMRLPPEWRENPDRLRNLYLDTKSGQRVPLNYVADIRNATGPSVINREDTQRRLIVKINPSTTDLNAAVERLQREIDEKIDRPEGYSLAIEGDYQAQARARDTIFFASAIVLLAILALLYSYFRSVRFVLLVLTIIPISLIGAVLYTSYTLNNISIATLVGFIAIAGIAARNNIMMISHYLHLMRHEGEGFTRRMVIRGTQERLLPVLMTALSAGIALVPLIWAGQQPGKEILYPVALAILGGLVTSTLLGLAVTPALFFSFCRKAAERVVARQAPATQ